MPSGRLSEEDADGGACGRAAIDPVTSLAGAGGLRSGGLSSEKPSLAAGSTLNAGVVAGAAGAASGGADAVSRAGWSGLMSSGALAAVGDSSTCASLVFAVLLSPPPRMLPAIWAPPTTMAMMLAATNSDLMRLLSLAR